MPKEKLLAEMGKFNEELVKAGVLLAADGLQPSSKGKRVRFSGDKRTVIDGPFTEAKELIAGYWLWQVRSMEEAVEWVKRCPSPHEGEAEIEIRQVFETEDFGVRVHSRAQEARGTTCAPKVAAKKRCLGKVCGAKNSDFVSILLTLVRRIDRAQIRLVETVRMLGSQLKN